MAVQVVATAGGRAYADTFTWTVLRLGEGRAKNVILFISDGMGYPTVTATRIASRGITEGKYEAGRALTPSGRFRISRQREDGWWEGDLGEIYRPKYFHGGIAVHGMRSVPNYPASHGCVRLSLPAMDFIWDNNLIPMGTPVWVHD